jgi:urate oxidase
MKLKKFDTNIDDGLFEFLDSSARMLSLFLQTDFLPFKLCQILERSSSSSLYFLQK